jgi:hypothetical protein
MAHCSRRSFLGGLLGALSAWLGGKARATPAPQPAAPTTPVPALQTRACSCDPLGTVTTSVYDDCGNFVYSTGPMTTYVYDCLGRTSRVQPPPDPQAQKPPAPDPGQPPLA